MTALKRSRPFRTRIRIHVEVRGARRSFLAQSRDLSVDGLCLSSPIHMNVGERAGASLLVAGRLHPSLSFEVRWIRPEGLRSYLLGAEFLHTVQTRKVLQKLAWEIESGGVRGIDPEREPAAP